MVRIRISSCCYLTVQMCILMWPLWKVVSGQRCHPLAHLLLDQQNLHRQETQTVFSVNFSITDISLFLLTSCYRRADSQRSCKLFVSSVTPVAVSQPTSVALPWLRACSVKLQLLWMCSFPWRREESCACRTWEKRGWGQVRAKYEKRGGKKRWESLSSATFCLVVQMFSMSVMRADLRWCSARSSSSNVLVISATASVFLSFSCREISLTSSMAAVSWGSLEGNTRRNFLRNPVCLSAGLHNNNRLNYHETWWKDSTWERTNYILCKSGSLIWNFFFFK